MDADEAAPVGAGDYVVRDGEDAHCLAARCGVTVQALMEHPDNREVAEAREAGVLLPGDRLTLPAPPSADLRVAPGQSHRFSATVPPHVVQLELRSGGQTHPAERYTAEVDGRRIEGMIGSDGMVTIPVRPSTRTIVLTVHEQWDDFEHDHVMHLRVGGLDPVSATTGVQARLQHLRFFPGRVDGELGPRTRDAVRRFQAAHGMEATGNVCEATRQRLLDEHGH